MSDKVIITKRAREVSGKLVQINEECRLPHHLALSLEDKGLCTIVAVGEPVAMVERVQPDVEVKTPAAKKAAAKAKKVAKARADAKVVTIPDMAGGNRTKAK